MTKKEPMFAPPWWLRSCHGQSCFNPIFPVRAKTPIVWEKLELPDGDFLDLCWAGTPSTRVVVLLHGLEGSVASHYIQAMLDDLVAAGWWVVVMHFRTCSGRLNRLPRSYHAGEINDLSYLVQVIRVRQPMAQVSIVGFSLGGNVTLQYLAKNPQSPVRCAATISVPFELNRCASHLAKFYQWTLLRTMKYKAYLKIESNYDMPVSLKELKSLKSFYEFDDAVTAPLHGFCSVKDYYEKVSVRPMLQKIKHPTLIIHALDDPFVPADCVPDASEISTAACLEVHKQGGHVGFVQGKPWKRTYWLKKRILDFLKKPIA